MKLIDIITIIIRSKNQSGGFFLGGLLIVIGVLFLGSYLINILVLLLVYSLFLRTSYFLNYFIPLAPRFGNCWILLLFKVVLIFYFSLICLLLAMITAFSSYFYENSASSMALIISESGSFFSRVKIIVY